MSFKNIFFLMLFGIFVTPVAFCSDDQGGEINKSDEKGKQGVWIYLGKDRPDLGYPVDGKIEEGSYKDSRKEGVWVKYHKDGVTQKLKGTYSNNRPNGAYTKFHANGEVKEVGDWDRNKYRDSLVRYHENGTVKYEANYNGTGKEEGSVKYFYPNGQLEYEYTAANGIQKGAATRYYENGDVKENIVYGEEGGVSSSEPVEMINPTVVVPEVGGSQEKAPSIDVVRTKGAEFKTNGYNKLYNSADEIWMDGDFRNGTLWDGKVYEYDSDGILLKVRVFKLGVYHSDGQL